MKKFITMILGVIVLTSCSNGLENQAKEQLKKTMKEVLKNPDSATLTNVRTELNNDSLCIIQFNCKAQNGFGGYSSSSYEYIYLKSDKDNETIYREAIYDLDETESVIKKAKNFHRTLLDLGDKDVIASKSAAELERDSINNIYLMAIGVALFNGREVNKDDGETINLK